MDPKEWFKAVMRQQEEVKKVLKEAEKYDEDIKKAHGRLLASVVAFAYIPVPILSKVKNQKHVTVGTLYVALHAAIEQIHQYLEDAGFRAAALEALVHEANKHGFTVVS
ncbi:MAG: hypothetical protein DRJ38_00335 [Thermoprotei archaeon]|nr:MAG: hypothetical protein DRJ38_00335 [Thermoprotei archaeon]